MFDEKVLLSECKRHTAHRVASAHWDWMRYPPISQIGVPTCRLDRGTPHWPDGVPPMARWGTPHRQPDPKSEQIDTCENSTFRITSECGR